MTPEEWLERNAITCEKHKGKWARLRCHDLAATSCLCDLCPKRPKKPKPGPEAQKLLEQILRHGAWRNGCPSERKNRGVTMERVDPRDDA